MQSPPNAAQLPGRSKACAFRHLLHVELSLHEEISCQRHAETIPIVRHIHVSALVEEECRGLRPQFSLTLSAPSFWLGRRR